MRLKHRIQINVIGTDGKKNAVLRGGVRTFPKRLLTALFGESAEVLVFTPGQSVQSVEIHELADGGDAADADER